MRDAGVRTDGTLGEFIDAVGAAFGERDAILASDCSGGEPVLVRKTYREFVNDVWALQAGLEGMGVRPGTNVAVLLSSFYEWLLYLFAITRLGGTMVPLSPRFGEQEVSHILGHSESEVLVSFGRYLGKDWSKVFEKVAGASREGRFAGLPALRAIIGVHSAPHPDSVTHSAVMQAGRRIVAGAGPAPVWKDAQSPAVMFYTSGTTGFPKGVPLTHANVLPHSAGCGTLIDMTPEDRVLTLYPFFGIVGGANKVLSTVAFGAKLIFQDAFRAEEAFDLLVSEQCTVVHALDVHVKELLPIARRRGYVAPTRRGTIAFMSGIDEALARQMADELGLERFVHGYGATEANPMFLRNELDDPFEWRIRPGGRPAPHVEVRVVDPVSGAEQPVDVPGEIRVRGRSVTRGYFRNAEATASAFSDGWFCTGDKGVRTSEGLVFFLSRSKDMLKVGGFSVAPQEIERFIRTHPGVEDVGVAGAQDARLGEVVVAFVKPRLDGRPTEQEIVAHCRGQIANYKVPSRVFLVDELPYHPAANGLKLRRDVLREWAGAS